MCNHGGRTALRRGGEHFVLFAMDQGRMMVINFFTSKFSVYSLLARLDRWPFPQRKISSSSLVRVYSEYDRIPGTRYDMIQATCTPRVQYRRASIEYSGSTGCLRVRVYYSSSSITHDTSQF